MLARRGLFISAVKQFFFPNGLLVLAALCSLAIAPAVESRSLPAAQWGAFALVTAGALLAVRLRSLRVFLGLCSLAAYLLVQVWAAIPSTLSGYLTALVALDFVLLLVVEDAYFDWLAAGWWSGLLFVQWTILVAAVRWDASLFSSLLLNRINLEVFSFGILELLFAMAVIALLGRFLYAPDAVGAGLLWGLASLAPGLHGSPMLVACVALSGIVLVVSAVERSHWIAYHDELTGLPARRAFKETLAALGEHYAIAIVDVDHFKRFNDTFGHDTGDQVLRKVARQLSGVGGGGVAFRCGGEEFALVFSDCDMDEAHDCCEDVREWIEDDGFTARGPSRSRRERPDRRSGPKRARHPAAVETRVTVSIGLAEASRGLRPEDVVEAADEALYKAKNLGRNRVERAASAPARPLRRKAAAAAQEPVIRP